jgi:Tfp pilus assembly protein PilF
VRTLLAGLLGLLLVAPSSAPAFVPARDDEVLEELPRGLAGAARALRAERARLSREPADLSRALAFAWRAIEAARAEADPRLLGWAEGALAPWLAAPDPPPAARLVRATLRQSRHDFAGALADLDAALARDPRSAQAWLTRAVVLWVMGEPAAAERSCRPLLRLADALTAATCLANAASLRGRAEAAAQLLRGALAEGRAAPPPGARVFALGSLAEIEARRGRVAPAEAAFRAALAEVPDDPYLLAAFADLLLGEGRTREVIALLEGRTAADGLLLRLVLAERRIGAPAAEAHAALLRARWAAARARDPGGTGLHAGEEARFALEVDGAPREALRLARANFAVQREPRDARILLEAALAAGEPEAAAPVLVWLARTRLEDVALARLAARASAGG